MMKSFPSLWPRMTSAFAPCVLPFSPKSAANLEKSTETAIDIPCRADYNNSYSLKLRCNVRALLAGRTVAALCL